MLRAELKAKLLLERRARLGPYHVLKLAAQHLANRTVELKSLRHTHTVHLYRDYKQAGSRKEINHVARPTGRKPKVFRLDEDECPLTSFVWLIGNYIFQDSAVGVGVLGP